MTRFAWTGSRAPKPAGRFPRHQELLVALDVIETVRSGDEVGVGGANGVDEIVLQTAIMLRSQMNLHIVVWPADGERTSWEHTRADIHLIRLADEVHWREPGWRYLERDRALVEWADVVTAMPERPFCWVRPGRQLAIVPHSGTNYTARYALEKNKLGAILPLNGRGHWFRNKGAGYSSTQIELLKSMAAGPV